MATCLHCVGLCALRHQAARFKLAYDRMHDSKDD